MPVNGFSVGKDIVLSLDNPSGSFNTAGLTSFNAKPTFTTISSKRLDGKTYNGNIPNSWSGSFKFDRLDDSIDTFFATLEANYYAGLNTPAGTIQETITEADGSTSIYRYEGVTLTLEDAGNWMGDARVEQTINFNATNRVKVQ